MYVSPDYEPMWPLVAQPANTSNDIVNNACVEFVIPETIKKIPASWGGCLPEDSFLPTAWYNNLLSWQGTVDYGPYDDDDEYDCSLDLYSEDEP